MENRGELLIFGAIVIVAIFALVLLMRDRGTIMVRDEKGNVVAILPVESRFIQIFKEIKPEEVKALTEELLVPTRFIR